MNLFARLNLLLLPVVLLGGVSVTAQPLAQDVTAAQESVPAEVEKTIISSLLQSRPTLKFDSVTATPIPGVYAVKVTGGPTLYATPDGRYFVLGDLFEVTDKGYVNIAEKAREGERAEKLAAIPESEMIIFSPAEQPAKASIMVFTDVDCFYCQKLHHHMADMNRLGIEVRYLAFPRAGIGSESYKKIASAWCADDRQAAMNKLKNRQPIPMNVCKGNPVAKHYKLGNEIGVNGTPALVTSDGHLMPGYMPPLQLANALGVVVDPVVAGELREKEKAEKH